MKMLAEDDALRAERKEPLDRRNEESSEELGKGEHGSQSGYSGRRWTWTMKDRKQEGTCKKATGAEV